MKLSIIIPCYNSGKNILKLIDSITSQKTGIDYEVIVQDGMSEDEDTVHALETLSSNPRIHVFCEKDKGIYDAMNRGVSHSKGEWLYFIGADDKMHSDTVFEEIFGSSNDDGRDNVLLIIGQAIFGTKLRKYTLGRKMKLENTVLHQAAFYHRSIFDEYSYGADFGVSSDYDLNYHCYSKHYKCRYVDTVICDFSLNGISSQVHWRSYREEITVRSKYIKFFVFRALLATYSMARYSIRKIIRLCK